MRPRKRLEEVKSKNIPTKFSLLDISRIDKQVEKERMSRSSWIRKVVLDHLNHKERE